MDTEKIEKWWLSAAEAAVLLDVNSRTVRRWIDARKLRGFRTKKTGEYRVLAAVFIRFCKDNLADYALEKFNERYKFTYVLPTSGS